MAQDNKELSRRDALEKLAKLSVYSAPTIVTLLSAQTSYAQTSEANAGAMNQDLPPGQNMQVNACLNMSRSNLSGNLGNDSGGGNSNDTLSDCGIE